ncbi:ABC transporter permease [Streptomyces griseofuscus]|uniref:ABC transporter permease n=1 Tax=Streptomyces griseofuscus TaxID=146922 RepID=A0A3R8SAU0_9ACTN|nr:MULTISPECIES: ABC transporter permease [Streptomyces]NDK28883.1 ABC transporter permease [Streptomyces sp. TR1341]BBC93884.1 ABC transporter permease [Streptomyces rochei]MBA9047898.1 peptide/nickel transport system permease protein [Streptomyces murinus]QNT93232.1 ABC transporter permease [Streptomyces griseofuscus]RRQ78072.1 ABC transporter permease [Streptomyces griseofuscus]
MLRFLVRRIIGAVVILFLLSIVTFVLFFGVPRDPALLMCGKTCNPDSIANIHHVLGLDKPLTEQYWIFLHNLVMGSNQFAQGPCPAPCFGYSYHTNDPVWSTLMDRLPTTVSLTLGAAVCFLIVGLGTGLLAAWRRGTLVDKTATGGAMVISALQIYFLGPLALAILVYQTHWFDKPAYNDFTGDPLSWFTGLIIPWVVLSTIFAAQYTRMARSAMIEQLQEEHVRTARAKGMSRRYVFFRYAWRGSLIPIVTIFGIDLGSLLGGAIITEYTFGLPGLGQLAVQSVFFSDLPLLLGVMLFAATMILVFNIVVDATYAFIDPRVRLS